MANKRNTVAYFKKQVDATTPIIPTGSADGYVSIEAPDVTTGEYEVLESELLSGSIGMKKPQLGFETASFSVTTELRSHGDETNPTEPDFGSIVESALGPADISVADAVAGTPTTTTFEVATIANFAVGMLVVVENSTDGNVARFIKAIAGDEITVNAPFTTAPTIGDVVKASVNYFPLNEGHSHITGGFYNGNAADGYFEQVVGSLISSLGFSIETGAIAKMSFEGAGLRGVREANKVADFTPVFEAVEGLVGFNVEVFFDDLRVCANKVELTVENEVSEKKSFCPESGKIGSIVRNRKISGNINPYMDGSVDYYSAIKALTDYTVSIVIGAKDASGFIAGKTVGIYLPQTMLTKDKTADIDDNLIEDLEFQAHTGASGNALDIVVSFA